MTLTELEDEELQAMPSEDIIPGFQLKVSRLFQFPNVARPDDMDA